MVPIKDEDFTDRNLIIKVIESGVGDRGLKVKFAGDRVWEIYDNAQSCCEERYVIIRDDLSRFADSQLYSIMLGDFAVEQSDIDGVKEIQFLIIKTSKGTISVPNYNCHNGRYGGFELVIEDVTDRAKEPSVNLRMRIES